MIKEYTTVDKAMKAASKRSLFANLNGKDSQYEVREWAGKWFAGYQGEMQEDYPFGRIIAQYSAGYRI